MSSCEAKRFDFEPAVTFDQLNEVEEGEKERGIVRRMALAFLTRSSDYLRENLADADEATEDAFLELVENIGTYLQHKEGEKELLECAQARILALLSEKYPESLKDSVRSALTKP